MSEISYPQTSRVVTAATGKIIVGIVGESGSGKSFLVHQLANDPDYGPDEILVLMSEDATASYDAPVHVVKVDSFDDVLNSINELGAMHAKGLRVPKVIFYDSPSGTGHDEMESYEANPIITKGGARDKLAEYGDFGDRFIRTMRRFQRRCPSDVIILVTSNEGQGVRPELILPGKVAPKNFTSLTSVTLHLKAVSSKVEADKGEPPAAAHRTVSKLPEGGYEVINRYFYTQNSGEIHAKGNKNLNIRERAIIGDVLRAIHGTKETA